MVTIQIPVDDDVKAKADALFEEMGLTTSDAIRLFLMQCLNSGGLPFTPTVRKPNGQTMAALNEKCGMVYKDVDELSKLWSQA